YLTQTASAQRLIRNADVMMGLECRDFWNTVNQWIDNGEEHGHGLRESRIKPNAKLITISSMELNTKANFQDFQRFQVADIGMAADSEVSLPYLIEAVRAAIPSDKKAALEKRGDALKKSYQQARERQRQTAVLGWEASPSSTARLNAEVYHAEKNE